MASYGFLCFAPTERGGRSGFKSQAIAEAEQTGRPVAEVADEARTGYIAYALLMVTKTLS